MDEQRKYKCFALRKEGKAFEEIAKEVGSDFFLIRNCFVADRVFKRSYEMWLVTQEVGG